MKTAIAFEQRDRFVALVDDLIEHGNYRNRREFAELLRDRIQNDQETRDAYIA